MADLGFGNRKPQPPISPTALSCASGDGLIALAGRTAKQCCGNGVPFGAAVAPLIPAVFRMTLGIMQWAKLEDVDQASVGGVDLNFLLYLPLKAELFQ